MAAISACGSSPSLTTITGGMYGSGSPLKRIDYQDGGASLVPGASIDNVHQRLLARAGHCHQSLAICAQDNLEVRRATVFTIACSDWQLTTTSLFSLAPPSRPMTPRRSGNSSCSDRFLQDTSSRRAQARGAGCRHP